MWKVQLACTVMFALLGEIEITGMPVGKCNTGNIVPAHLPTKQMEKHLKWRVWYVTDSDSIEDHENYFLKLRLNSGKNYVIRITRVLKDSTLSKQNYEMEYTGNMVIEDTVDVYGEHHRYYDYPLEVTPSLAFLGYRCSEIGDPNIFYRYIVAPVNTPPSESEIQNLLARDKAVFGDSHGSLIKLPNQIED